MFALKDILDSLYETFNAVDEKSQEKVSREMRKAYYELCGYTSWAVLRDSIVYAYDEDADGMWLPADLIGIDCVSDGERTWDKSNMAQSLDRRSMRCKWFVAEVNTSPLVSNKGIKISDGSDTFTGPDDITEDMVGEYIRIGGQPSVYKLASTTTLETTYYGPKQTNGDYEVRPYGVKRIKLLQEQGATDTTAATIYFWRLPPQLYNGSQMMMLPTSALLENAVKIKIFGIRNETELKNGAQKDQYGAKGRYEGELSRCEAINPVFIPPVTPRGPSWGGGGR